MFERIGQDEGGKQEEHAGLPEGMIDYRVDIDSLKNALMDSLAFSEREAREVIYTMANLVYKMRERLPMYDMVIGDDASARLVTRFMRTCINDVRTAQALPRVKTRFVCGGNVENVDEVHTYIKNDIDLTCSRALFVTEYILTGGGIQAVVDTLQQRGVAFDVAALSMKFAPYHVQNGVYLAEDGSDTDIHFYFGAQRDVGIVFYGNAANGVVKNLYTPHVQRDKFTYNEKMERGRKAMDMCAHEIVRKLVLSDDT